jgi:hypothetical protein
MNGGTMEKGKGSGPVAGRFIGSQAFGLVASLAFAAIMVAAIWVLTPALARFESSAAGMITRDASLVKAERAAHYEWKLNEPTLWTRLSSWGLYALHQVLAWGMIAWGALRKKRASASGERKISDRLAPAGIGFLAVNVVFGFLHLLQTQLFYDGLAQDVAVFSSQASVVVMLILILIIQNDRRGLFFGKRVWMPNGAVGFIKKYHGYYIAWALIYTLWFHPMTGTFGHLVGFFYMFALLAQGVLLYTRLHASLKWSAFLEALVLMHGATVAFVGQASPLWTMFALGFGFMFIATQLWGLKLSKPVNLLCVGIYIAAAAFLYSGALGGLGPLFAQGPNQVHQVLWIPITLYGLIPVFLILAGLMAWIGKRITKTIEKSGI